MALYPARVFCLRHLVPAHLFCSHQISTTQVFTSATLLEAVGGQQATLVSLSRATKDGKVHKVRKGLYVSNSGRFIGLAANPYLIAQTFRPDAAFVYHSALALQGVSHSLSNRVQFMAPGKPVSFVYNGVVFQCYSNYSEKDTQSLAAKAYGTVRVTTREQTLIDCFSRVGRSGGAEEVMRSLNGFAYLDVAIIVEKAASMPASVVSRIGWYLECNQERLRISDKQISELEAMVPRSSSSHLDPMVKRSKGFSSRWRLNLPAPADEIDSWME